ncbi:MAG: endonuclease/exonuclease/phosphatase family protein [Deltaproteobacteria bacterium]|nr:endonuclease/exonuclease/phosphatase family protein [Deltaproteobacteria bacterium]
MALLPGCDAVGLRAIERLSTQNAGTTTFLELFAPQPPPEVRADCSDWYSNNLCLLAAEQKLAAAIEEQTPDLLFLQEIWHQPDCEEAGRPAELNAAPYVCAAGSDLQIQRLLPDGYRFGCAGEYPDNCIAFRDRVFEPDGGSCDDDCSALLVSNPAACGRDGRLASIRGRIASGHAIFVVVHTNAGVGEEAEDCRAAQLEAIQQALASEPASTAIFMAGDFNFDPEFYDGADAQALAHMVAALGLTRLPVDGYTHLISMMQLDQLYTRGWPSAPSVSCLPRFLDESEDEANFDHAFVSCR